MKGIFEPSTFCKCSRRLPTSGKSIIAAALAAMMLLSLAACGKVPPTGNGDQDPSADTDISPDEDTSGGKDTPANEDGAADDAWKAAFEKSLLENYGVKPDHYEELKNGIYQVYVEIDGKVVPYVAVDSATGDYHG